MTHSLLETNSPRRPEELPAKPENEPIFEPGAIEIDTLEQSGFVKEPATLEQQKDDLSRVNTIRMVQQSQGLFLQEPQHDHTVELTEHDAIQGLCSFLEAISSGAYEGLTKEQADIARNLLDNLSFIGEKEYQEGSAGLASYWKKYLEDEPERKIYIFAQLQQRKRDRYLNKSASFLLNNILGHFTEEEKEAYQDRIEINPDSMTVEPEKTKVIFLDDWSVSGTQLINLYDKIIRTPETRAYRSQIEVNLLVARKDQIDDGLSFNDHNDNFNEVTLPIKSYYRAPEDALLTGFHSSVDYGFEQTLQALVEAINARRLPENAITMPPLTNIIRPYR